MATLGLEQLNVKVVPVHMESPSHVVINIKQATRAARVGRRVEKCWKLTFAWFIVSIVQYGIGIMIYMLFVPKSHRTYTISELTWIPYCIGLCCIHVPLFLCVYKLEPGVDGCEDYFRCVSSVLTK